MPKVTIARSTIEMKIRTGFVSNSSSSSFVIIGYEFLWEHAEELIKQLVPKKYEAIVISSKEAAKKYSKEGDTDEDFAGLFKDCFGDAFSEFLREDNALGEDLSILTCGYSGSVYIGHVISDEVGDVASGVLQGEEVIKIMKNIQTKIDADKPPCIISGSRGC